MEPYKLEYEQFIGGRKLRNKSVLPIPVSTDCSSSCIINGWKYWFLGNHRQIWAEKYLQNRCVDIWWETSE